jgi:hypothetical protein
MLVDQRGGRVVSNGVTDCDGVETHPLHGCWVVDDEGNVRGSGGELIPVVAGVLALLIALGAIFRGMTRITWDSFGQRFSDGDHITKQVAPGTPGVLTVTLEAGPKVSWWKDVEIRDTQNVTRAAAWTQDNHRRSTLTYPNSELEGAVLVLMKAKGLGIHTPMYALPVLKPMADQHVTLRWERDS